MLGKIPQKVKTVVNPLLQGRKGGGEFFTLHGRWCSDSLV